MGEARISMDHQMRDLRSGAVGTKLISCRRKLFVCTTLHKLQYSDSMNWVGFYNCKLKMFFEASCQQYFRDHSRRTCHLFRPQIS